MNSVILTIFRTTVMIGFISLYFICPNPYTKAFPALSLVLFLPISRYGNLAFALFLAAFGDYYLGMIDISDLFWVAGIMSFSGFHVCLIILTRIGEIYSRLVIKKYLGVVGLLGIGVGVFISMKAPHELMLPVLFYSLLLSILLVSSIGIVSIEGEIRKKERSFLISDDFQKWEELNSVLYHPRVFLVGVILFIVSDLCVFSQMLGISGYIQYIGLMIYWVSLLVIVQSFIKSK